MAFRPMPLSRKPAPFDDPEWIFELKYDGFRSLAIIHSGQCELISRNGHPFNSFSNLRMGLTFPYQGKTVLDGEIVCLDKRGKPQFNDLLFHRGEPYFFAFDLLMADGKDLRTERLTDRKHELRRLLSKVPASRMQYVEHVEQHGKALFETVCKLDLEGIVAKHGHGPYITEPQQTSGSRSETGTTLRWKVGRSCLSANVTKSRSPAGIVVNWLARNWRKTMGQFEGQFGNCGIEYAASWSDQSLPCGKLAVARCDDCGSSICSDCQMECCGQSFCVQCYDYHVTHGCLRKPIHAEYRQQEKAKAG